MAVPASTQQGAEEPPCKKRGGNAAKNEDDKMDSDDDFDLEINEQALFAGQGAATSPEALLAASKKVSESAAAALALAASG